MKVPVVLCCVCFAVLQLQTNIATAKAIADVSNSSSEKEELSPNAEACVDELHLDKQLIIQLNYEQIAPEDNTQLNKFMDCYWQKNEWMDSNGEIKHDKILDYMTETIKTDLNPEVTSIGKNPIKDAVDHCVNHPSKGSSNGQTAVRFRNCVTSKLNAIAEDFSSEEDEELVLSSKEEDCIDELHLDTQHITKLNNMGVFPDDNGDFNKFLACYWMKEEWMDSNGEIKRDKILNYITEMMETDLKHEDPEKKSIIKKAITDAVDHCINHPSNKGSSNGQTAVRVQNCISNILKEMAEDFSSEEDEDLVLSSKERDCVGELHLDAHQITKLNNREVVPEDNVDFNKFLACYWMKEEWMNSKGKINFDNFQFSLRAMAAIAYEGETHEVKRAMMKRISNAIDFCQKNPLSGNSYGQTAAKMQNCINAKLSKEFYI